MPDIAMCGNPEKCPKADTCWRVLATPKDKWQNYIAYYKEGEECRMYWPVYEVEDE